MEVDENGVMILPEVQDGDTLQDIFERAWRVTWEKMSQAEKDEYIKMNALLEMLKSKE